MIGWLPRLLLIAIGLAALAWALSPLWLAFLVSILFYLLLSPLVSKLQVKGASRDMAIFLSLAPALLLLVIVATYSINTVRAYLPNLANDLTRLQQSAVLAMTNLDAYLEMMLGVCPQLAEKVRALDLNALIQTEKLLASTGVFINIAVNLAIVPPLAYFLLRDYTQWRDKALSLLPNHQFELGWLMYYSVSTRLQAYLRGLVWQAMILATITSLGFWIAGFPLPILLGALTGICGLVPYLGPFLSLIAPTVMLMLGPVFDPGAILQAVLVIVVGFGFDNMVTIPFLLAGTVNVHPMMAVVAVLLAGHIGGIPAMIVVIPSLGILKIMLQTLIHGLGAPVAQAQPQ